MRSVGFLALDPPQWFSGLGPVAFPALLAVHEDGVSFVDSRNPARKGETIHAYMTGLGPVDQDVRDGELPPGDPPARPVTGIACDGAETVDAILAPELIGIYRVSLRLLQGAPRGTNHRMLFCDGTIANRMALPMLPEE